MITLDGITLFEPGTLISFIISFTGLGSSLSSARDWIDFGILIAILVVDWKLLSVEREHLGAYKEFLHERTQWYKRRGHQKEKATTVSDSSGELVRPGFQRADDSVRPEIRPDEDDSSEPDPSLRDSDSIE